MRKEYENNIAKLIEEKLDIEMDKFKINNFVLDLVENKDKEIERLNKEKDSWKRVATKNFNEAEDYKAIIKEVREYAKKVLSWTTNEPIADEIGEHILEIVEKENI